MLHDIILSQKQELENKFDEKYIERQIDYNKFNNDLIKVITGPRRSGKSFLGMYVLKQKGSFGYVNFDDERLIDIKNYDEIVKYIDLVYGNPKWLLFDEIQNLKNWELFINRLHRNGRNIIITGSNSKLLSKELASHLTGRHINISVFPFSFSEYLKLVNTPLTGVEKKVLLANYVECGGFPEPLVKKINVKDYLSILFDSILYKDIVKRYKIRYSSGIENLANYFISNISKEFSLNAMTKLTEVKNIRTIQKYLFYLEEVFIFFRVNRFSYKIREQMISNKKIYCIDNGLIYSKAFKFSPEIGRLYENIVAIALKKKELDNKINFYFWKNKENEEVDFVIKVGNKITQLIQVCFELKNTTTLEREKRALLKASKELNCDDPYIINDEIEKEEMFKWYGESVKIKYIPLWKWLLENS